MSFNDCACWTQGSANQDMKDMFLYRVHLSCLKISVLRTTVLENSSRPLLGTKRSKQLKVLLYCIFNDVLLYVLFRQCFVNKVHLVVASAAMTLLFKMKTNVSRTLHFYQKLALSSILAQQSVRVS